MLCAFRKLSFIYYLHLKVQLFLHSLRNLLCLFVGEVALLSLALFLDIKNGETYETHLYKKLFIRNLNSLFILKKQFP